jgi:hypothetical protein
MERLPLDYRFIDNDAVGVVATILVEAKSRGEVNAGEYGRYTSQPNFEVETDAGQPADLTWDCVKRGGAERYVLLYRFENRGDSRTVVTVRRAYEPLHARPPVR